MRCCIALLGVALLATVVVELLPSATGGMAAVSDSEAATLYGGACVDPDPNGPRTHCPTAAGGCLNMSCYGQFIIGTGNLQDINCGANACGQVVATSGTCAS